MLIQNAKVGVQLIDLDEKANQMILENGATCSFYKYRHFPKHICISVNEQLIHGIPDHYVIRVGDLITFDVCVQYQNHHCDAAFSVIVGVNSEAQKILDITMRALEVSILKALPGNKVGDISYAIQSYVHSEGYEVIEDFGGHGCGIKLHEDPIILNFGQPNTGVKLIKNMVICIEPMVLTQSNEYYIDRQNK
jgi:methionyl aminopeptidase